MSAFRELVDAIQDKPLVAMDFGVEPPTVYASAFFVSTMRLVQQAHDEHWDRRKLKRMMRRAGEGKGSK